MTTDTAKLIERFRKFCQEWDLQSGEADMQAQNKALIALHDWLRTGVNSPEVVIRAVQVLMADPEAPGIHKRPAVNQVFSQITTVWQSAGLTGKDVIILQGMILAAWLEDTHDKGLDFACLLESAWPAIPVSPSKNKHLTPWRGSHPSAAKQAVPSRVFPLQSITPEKAQAFPVPNHSKHAQKVHSHFDDQYGSNRANALNNLFNSYQETFNLISQSNESIVNTTNKTYEHLSVLASKINEITKVANHLLSETNTLHPLHLDLLWWGQSRYSNVMRRPYRRITSTIERLWWMAWESSELCVGLEIEPSACFLVETLYQLTSPSEDRKRPLKEWLSEFIDTLRRIHDEGKHAEEIAVSNQLEQIAKKDALGLPITWARLEAANPRASVRPIEERIRENCAVDLETEIDLGDWASWIFREALLDRRLGAK